MTPHGALRHGPRLCSAPLWTMLRIARVALRCVRGTRDVVQLPTTDTASHSRDEIRPSSAHLLTLFRTEGAGKAGSRLAPAVHCARHARSKCTAAYRRSRKHPGLPCAVVRTAYVVISPGRRA